MNPNRILGHLLNSGLRTRTPSGGGFNLGGKAGLGMGALGLAFAAYEHFANQSAQTSATSGPPSSTQASPTPSGSSPPPLPASNVASTPPSRPPPPPSPASGEESQLLIRAMIAAANADGLIDQDEEKRIMDSARRSGLDDQDLDYLESEINRPRSMFEIVAGATSPDLAKQVYAASLLAVNIDTDHERAYLRQLASSLHLSNEDVTIIESELGISRE